MMKSYEFESPQQSKVMTVEGSLEGVTMPVIKRSLCPNLFIFMIKLFKIVFSIEIIIDAFISLVIGCTHSMGINL